MITSTGRKQTKKFSDESTESLWKPNGIHLKERVVLSLCAITGKDIGPVELTGNTDLFTKLKRTNCSLHNVVTIIKTAIFI